MNANLVIYLEDTSDEALATLHQVLTTYNLQPNSRIEGYTDQECSFEYCERLATKLGVSNDFY